MGDRRMRKFRPYISPPGGQFIHYTNHFVLHLLDHREIANLKEDLLAVRTKASADEEVISVLRKQVEELQKEKETL